MPSKHKKGFKKVYRKMKKSQRKLAQYVNPIKKGGFPDTYFTPLSYLTNQIAMGDNTAVAYQRLITLNDPTNNNAISPIGWSILRDVYDTCLVHMSKIKLTFQNTSSSVPCRVVVCPLDTDTSNITQTSGVAINLTTFNYMAQSPYAKVYNLSALGGGKDTVTVKCMIKVAKYAGEGKHLKPNNDRFLLQTGGANSTRAFTQPTALYRWVYAVVTSTGANLGISQVYVSSEVTYYCQFIERLAAVL